MRKILLNCHLYGALVAGLFLIAIGTTGGIIAFEPELDELMHPDLFHVAAEGKQLSASELFRAAEADFPGQKIGALTLPQREGDPAQFGLRDKRVFLNPYTGAVTGTRTGVTTLSKIHQMHQRLLMGETGAQVVTAAAVVMMFLAVSGVCLWWPLKRASVKWNASAFRLYFDLHSAVGIYSVLFLFVLAATGVAVHFDNAIEDFLHKSAGTKKIGRNVPSGAPGGERIDADRAVEIALHEMPGTRALSVSLPGNAKASYVVTVRFPEDRTPGGRSWVNVDQYNGAVVGEQNSRTVAMGSRAIIWNRAIHTGDVYGLPTKALMSVSSLMVVVQAVTGYLMWWRKLRAGAEG